ncbi:MAG: HlyC/CorC family transporter [Pyrinomonadaceae bacterium]|nr:HlyC/CorC family transporter [Pyrinomonadaceae bacterium]
MEIEIGITCLLLLLLAFLATVDVAFGQLSDVGLRRLGADSGELQTRGATFLRRILEDRSRFRFVLSATMQTIIVAVSVLIASLAWRWFADSHFILIAFFVGTLVAITFRQLIPRLIAVRNPERVLLALLPILRPLYSVLSLIGLPFGRSSPEALRRERQQQPLTETTSIEVAEETNVDNLQALIDVGEEEGILEEEEGDLIHSIIEFGDTRVSEVMTPRTEIVALPIAATVREARDVIIDSKYSRLPVYRDQIDNVEGIIYVRDLLACWPEGSEDASIKPLLRPAFFVPETKEVSDLLEEMQKAHVHLAMVIDEYGGVAGLVSVEDILEEIVGEIEDEDTETNELIEIVESTNGFYEVLGSTEIGKIERVFDLEIEDDDFTTVAGLVINELGCVPRVGTQLSFRGLEVEVLDSDERRINRLRLRRVAEEVAQTEGKSSKQAS